uniref:Uncharacterized protein n=1 Tax=Quercus lobata TaxID=97700 RepID=A0A7N2MK60_QUELO
MSHDFGSVHSDILNFECLDRTDSNTELIQVLLRSHEISWVRARTVVNYSFEFAPVHNLCPTSMFFWNLIYNLAGVKVLHGIDKVVEGGAVVLTLKDQNILADGDINEEIDMLENVELGEQKQRDEAYKAAKKKTGIYDDKFNDDPGAEKKILPQYDDPTADEGLALDERGCFSGEAEKKLQELRKRLEGTSTNNHFEDLNAIGKITSDYYTQEEMLQFKKPKKKKSLRKKEKLDLDALEAEALSSGLGVGDLGSWNDARRQAIREEQERAEAELRNNAYQSAYAKADEAS